MAQEEAQLRLMFADGTERSVDVWNAAAVLRGYAVSARIFRSRRVFDMVVEYAEKHAAYRRGDDDEEQDIEGWDRRFIARVDDTDILHDLFLASAELEEYELMDLCAQRTADMIRGGTVEEIRTLLGITDIGLTPEQDLLEQHDHDHLLRIIR